MAEAEDKPLEGSCANVFLGFVPEATEQLSEISHQEVIEIDDDVQELNVKKEAEEEA